MKLEGLLKLLILKELANKDACGYELINRIEEITSKKPSSGSIYPLLNDLNEKGFLEVKSIGGKKVYSLSEKGKEYLKELKEKEKELIAEKVRFLIRSGILSEEDAEEMLAFIRDFRDMHRKLYRIKNWIKLENAVISAAEKDKVAVEKLIEEFLEKIKLI